MCEGLPVSRAISQVPIFLGLKGHRSLVGMCERVPSKSFFGGDVEFLM